MERPTATERDRAVREEQQRKARLSLRVGGIGIVILFLGGVGAWLLPDQVLAFLIVMAAGIVLLVVALSLVWEFAGRFRLDDETKLY